VDEVAGSIAARAERELRSLVGVSSPSGDVAGAQEALAVAEALAPEEARAERVPCSSPEHAPDLVLRLSGSGSGRLLLVGHVDTVIPHRAHRPLTVEGDRLAGSGTVDMKGGVVLALGVLRALAPRAGEFAEAALLLVCDEEWRTAPFAHVARFEGFDACLCFEAGQLTEDGQDAVVVKRKAAGTLRVRAHGRQAHSGSAPDRGINALLALARAAQLVAEQHAPAGDHRLTAVPTVMRSGDAFNVVPAEGELVSDLRADDHGAFEAVRASIPSELEGARMETEMLRVWPGMDSRDHTSGLLARTSEALGRRVVAAGRGGASDASHFAASIQVTVDGLGPRGGGAHAPHEHVLRDSLRSRAEVAAAMVHAWLLAGAEGRHMAARGGPRA
jgi:glutamate carboxypeptidase